MHQMQKIQPIVTKKGYKTPSGRGKRTTHSLHGGLAKMMDAVVEVYLAFASIVSAKKTGTMCMPPTTRIPRTMVRVEAAGQIYEQGVVIPYLPGGAVTKTPDTSVEIGRRTRACWMRIIRRYRREIEDQPEVAVSLKTRMVKKVEVIDALLYGRSTTWILRQEHYDKLRTVHDRVLPRIIGTQRKRRDNRMTSYNLTMPSR